MNPDSAMLSVVVTTFNRRALLARCLRSLVEQDYAPEKFEVIVVDDGSTDDTQQFLSDFKPEFDLRIIAQTNRGLAAARNAGMKAARNSIVLLLDDDLICSPVLLSEHSRAHGQIAGPILGFGKIDFDAPAGDDISAQIQQRHYCGSFYDSVDRGAPPVWPTHARIPPNSSFPKDAVLDIGGFDEQFVNAHEDIELGIRLWQRQVKFVYLPAAKTVHVGTVSSNNLAVRGARRGGNAEVLLCRKHPVYRSNSTLASIHNNRIFRQGFGDFALKSSVVGGATRSALALARRLGITSRSERFLALETGLNSLHSAVKRTGSWPTFHSEFWMQLPVLMYHHVGNAKDGMYPGLSITPRQFTMQIESLARDGYTGITCRDWIEWHKSARPLPEKPVLITMDDAYTDTAEFALPILKKFGFSAVVFVVTSHIGGSNEWDQRHGRPALSLMTAGEIERWAAEGIEFGAHSRTHPELDRISRSQAEDEIEGSRRDLEKLLGRTVVSFAYPYGCYDSEAKALVRRSFEIAFTTTEGLNNLGADLLEVRRMWVYPSSHLAHFRWLLRHGFSPYVEIEKWLRGTARSIKEKVRGR